MVEAQSPAAEALVPLGRSGLRVSPLGVGTWAWGDRLIWGYGRGYTAADLQAAFQASVAAGVTFFDTAEIYGWGTSERLLGRFLAGESHGASQTGAGGDTERASSGSRPVLATKFFPFPWRLRRQSLLRALRGSLRRLGMAPVDLYQIHWPFPPVPIDTWVDGLAEAVEQGLTRAVGVSNYSAGQLRRAHDRLARRGIPLASNQVQYSLLHRAPERDGVLAACRDLGVTLIAYSPLAMGLLTGKYSLQQPPPGWRARRYPLTRIGPLVDELSAIGEVRGGKSPSQVALNWLMAKGALPIPGAKTARQAQDNAGALGWRLTEDEVARLDQVSGAP